MSETTFPKPVFIGDTIRVETEVMAKRLSKSRPGEGIVSLQHYAFNQRDELSMPDAARGADADQDSIDGTVCMRRWRPLIRPPPFMSVLSRRNLVSMTLKGAIDGRPGEAQFTLYIFTRETRGRHEGA